MATDHQSTSSSPGGSRSVLSTPPDSPEVSSLSLPAIAFPTRSPTNGSPLSGPIATGPRVRVRSNSAIRAPFSLSAAPSLGESSASLMSMPAEHSMQIARAISNPLPPHTAAPSAASTVSASSTSSRLPWRSNGDRAAPRSESTGRSRSPLRDLAVSWSTLRTRKMSSGASSAKSGMSWDSNDGNEEDIKSRSVRSSWWPVRSSVHSEKRNATLSPEQDQTLARVKQKVAQATKDLLPSSEAAHEALNLSLQAAHDVLAIGAEVLQFAPVVGLAEAARVLVTIWDAVQLVDLNQRACLRLTERCANLLISVREELAQADVLASRSPRSTHSSPLPSDSRHTLSSPDVRSSSSSPRLASGDKLHYGDETTPRLREKHLESSGSGRGTPGTTGALGDELQAPMEKLITAFNRVFELLEKQIHRPFLKRYLKREEIQQEIVQCDALLTDALSMFSVSIQIRILKLLMQSEEQRKIDNEALIDRLLGTPPMRQPNLPSYESATQVYATSEPKEATSSLLFENDPRHVENKAGDTTLDALDLRTSSLSLLPAPAAERSIMPERLSTAEIMSHITRFAAEENEQAFAHDAAYLRRLLTSALAANDDLEMIRILQVSREEMPEALKALQRALEVEVEREEIEVTMSPAPVEDESIGSTQGILEGILGSNNERNAQVESDSIQERKSTHDSYHSRTSTVSKGSAAQSHASRDTLDREFLESGIESLRRLSLRSSHPASSLSLPPWTITRYEVDKDVQIGIGFFSSVWRGTYKGRTVAIKILAPWTPQEMFMREVAVWRTLKHRNVLELIGASAIDTRDASSRRSVANEAWADRSAIDEEGPWFFVSRYYQRGSLVKWVKGMDKDTWTALLLDVSGGVLRMIHEVVQGMAYLHAMGVLHGDLKCANILVDDDGHCILSDFGQSELKSEAYRLSGVSMPQGTLRWQAPEVMSGQSQLTSAVDVYASAITCVELLTKGSVPWPMVDDDQVRHFVLKENLRPTLPMKCPWSAVLAEVISQCWQKEPSLRPPFTKIDVQIGILRTEFGWDGKGKLNDPQSLDHGDSWLDVDSRKSPEMRPMLSLPPLPPDVSCHDVPSSPTEGFPVTGKTNWPREGHNGSRTRNPPVPEAPLPENASLPIPNRASSTDGQVHSAPGRLEIPQTGSQSPNQSPSAKSPHLEACSNEYEDLLRSPLPIDESAIAIELRNEQRYRMSLRHEFERSLVLPLWTPSPIAVGAVGYHSRPLGSFITLLNAFHPVETSAGKVREMKSLYHYGQVPLDTQKHDKRSAAQRGIDKMQGWLNRSRPTQATRSASRRYTAPLRTGQRSAHLFTEQANYRCISDLDIPRKWFRDNIAQLTDLYSLEHSIAMEDFILVTGTLDAANYALFVSHDHPDSQLNFDVFSSSRPGQKWGQFSVTDSNAMHLQGTIHDEAPSNLFSASKVSATKNSLEQWDTVLVARLRFPTDRDEPTSKL